jgi:hypothetical protein
LVRYKFSLWSTQAVRNYWVSSSSNCVFHKSNPSSIELLPSAIAITTKLLDQNTYQRLKAAISPYTMWYAAKETATLVWHLGDAYLQPDQEQNPQHGPSISILPPSTPQDNQEGDEEGDEGDEEVSLSSGIALLGASVMLSGFMKGYHHHLSLLRKTDRSEPDRGSIRISGLVEVIGTKGAATVDIIVDYDIKEKAFKVLDLALRSLRPRSQKPKRSSRVR